MKLVYRALRKISDWTIGGFYSEVYVDGQENVPNGGPLIIASSHHNEIIDIAVLSVTIPYRRHISFWAKSTLFNNPIARAILLSSGSIPVQRNLDISSTVSGVNDNSKSLFMATSTALAKDAVVGVFPEGTSYTEPRIVQVKDGAARAAMEYARWVRGEGGSGQRKKLVLVPVGIVYTDKSQYQSRVRVTYGKPVELQSFTDEFFSFSEDQSASRSIVHKITTEIERAMTDLTVNSPDWDTLYAARMAREILWDDERKIPLKDFVRVSQILVNLFSPTSTSPPQTQVKDALIKYWSLLHYSTMTHSTLASIYPLPTLRSLDLLSKAVPTTLSAFLKFIVLIPSTFLHPRFLLFLPAFMCHTPAYLTGYFAARFLTPPGEDESKAQFKVIFGGLGLGLEFASVSRNVVKWLTSVGQSDSSVLDSSWAKKVGVEDVVRRWGLEDLVKSLGEVLSGGDGALGGKLKRVLAIAGVYYLTAWTLFTWHNALVGGNYRQLKRLVASFKIFSGLLSPQSSDINGAELQRLSSPPPPRINPFIRKRKDARSSSFPAIEKTQNAEANGKVKNKTPRPRKLIRPLLAARAEAAVTLGQYLTGLSRSGGEGKEAIHILRELGAKLD